MEDGAEGRFYPDDAALPPVNCRITRVDRASAANLSPYFASVYGGEVAARKGGNATLVPESAVYRVLLKPERSDILTRLPHTLRGQVYIASGGRSLLLRAWRQAVAAVIRESGF